MKNILMVISGPSGVGKGTIVKKILERREDVVASVSCTTRSPRKGEVDGKDYFFLSREEFLKRKEEGDFLECDEHFGNFYGTPMSFVKETLKERSVILEIDVVGALNAKRIFPESVLVMILPPSVEELKKRLSGRRSETEEEIENRLKRLDYELEKKELYDYAVVNDELEVSVKQIEEIIDQEKIKESEKI
ncbi:MAG: guanylate kinase [Clostridia bacterium]|nr:guanylate kinase [Clostridia bacterium]